MRRTRALLQDEITRAAAECFGEIGYRATTLDAVAARAGVSKVTLYRHVRSKEELLGRVFDRTIEAFRGGLRRIVAERLPPDEALRRIVRYQVTLLTTHLPFLRVFFAEEGGLPPEMARRVAREKREYDRTIERVVRDGIDAGRLRALPPTLVVFGALGMCNWLHTWYRPDGGLTAEQIASVFVDLLERGYLAPARAAASPEDVAGALRRLDARVARLDRRLRALAPARPAPVRP